MNIRNIQVLLQRLLKLKLTRTIT